MFTGVENPGKTLKQRVGGDWGGGCIVSVLESTADSPATTVKV